MENNAADLSPLFISAHAAIVFALNFSSQCYERPAMNKMASPAVGTGKGLVGLDGAAQAGMIRSEMKTLGKLAEAILVARIAPRSIPCECRSPCCSGHRPNDEWTNAIAVLSDRARTTALAGCSVNGLMRRDFVVRYFDPKDGRISIEALADRHNIARNTASAHVAKVSNWLGGAKAGVDKQPVPGFEQIAMSAIEDRLREIGMVGY